MINYTKLLNNLETLKLDKILAYLPNYLSVIKEKDVTLVDSQGNFIDYYKIVI